MNNNIDILPDSRARDPKDLIPSKVGYWTPLDCASCGNSGGMVPEENCNFAFWLCKDCFEKYGEIAGTLVVPDQVFWQKAKEEQLEKYGRLLDPVEIDVVAREDASPLATLIREGFKIIKRLRR